MACTPYFLGKLNKTRANSSLYLTDKLVSLLKTDLAEREQFPIWSGDIIVGYVRGVYTDNDGSVYALIRSDEVPLTLDQITDTSTYVIDITIVAQLLQVDFAEFAIVDSTARDKFGFKLKRLDEREPQTHEKIRLVTDRVFEVDGSNTEKLVTFIGEELNNNYLLNFGYHPDDIDECNYYRLEIVATNEYVENSKVYAHIIALSNGLIPNIEYRDEGLKEVMSLFTPDNLDGLWSAFDDGDRIHFHFYSNKLFK